MRGRWVVGLLGVCAALLFAAGAQAVHDLTFQLDGDVSASTTTNVGGNTQSFDWDSFFNSAGQPSPVLPSALRPGFTNSEFTRDFLTNPNGSFNSNDATTFTTGSKDTLNISSGWQCTASNNLGDKVDIMNAYALAYTAPNGHQILYFALERNGNSGAGNVAFWFLQDQANCDGSNGTASWTGNHTDGDLLVTSSFTVGGSVSTIDVFRWDGGANGTLNTVPVAHGVDCRSNTTSTGDPACATVNTGTISTPWLTSNKQDGPGHSLRTSEFFEGGLDLTQSNLSGKCFSTFVGDTRSSPSPTATIFDFAQGHFEHCGANIQINPPTATNEVGQPHTFTVTVNQTVNGNPAPAPDGTHATVTLTGTNGANPVVTQDNCGPTGPGTVNGQCTVIFSSSTAGTVTGHAAADVTVQGQTFHVETDGTDDNSTDATKVFVDAKLSLSPLTATNAVGQQHTITLTLLKNAGDGNGFVAASGATCTVTLTASNGANPSPAGPFNVTTNASGQATVTFTSASAGQVSAHASCNLTVGGVSLHRESDSTHGSTGDANKTFVDANVTLSPLTATNAVSQSHTVTVTVKKNLGDGAGFVPASGATCTVALSASNGANPSPAGPFNVTTNASGLATVTFTSNSAGQVAVHASCDLTVSGVSLHRESDSTHGSTGNAVKTFVDGRISITPAAAVNGVRQNHTITATVQQDDGLTAAQGGDGVTGFGPAPNGTLVTFSITNSNGSTATFVGGNTCTTTGGICTVQIVSPTAGLVTIHATTTFSVSGQSITRSTGDGLSGDSGDATKRFVDARITLSPLTAVNGVRTPHTIVATVLQDDGLSAAQGGDGISGFGPAPNGTTVTFSLLNNNAGATFVAGSSCTISNGTCSIQITSTSAGTVDIRGTTTFLVGGQSLTRTTGDGLSGDSADANKRYVDARISLSPLTAVNEVGHTHTLTVTILQDDGLPAGAQGGDGANGFGPAPDGTTAVLTLLNNFAGASFVLGNTCNTSAGTCTVAINSLAAGTVDIQATTTFSVGGQSLTRTTGDGLSGDSPNANKRYVDAKISLSPLTATNFVRQLHTITATVQQDDGLPAGAPGGDGANGFGPAPNGTSVTFTLLNNTAGAFFVGGVSTCTTSGGTGQCSIQISSNNAGGVDIHATTTFSVGGVSLTRATGTGPPNSADAHKDFVRWPSQTTTHPQQNGQNVTGITFGQSVTDHAQVDGNATGGAPTGTVSFFICSPSQLTNGVCSSGGTPLGASPLTQIGSTSSSQADSASFTPDQPGAWCFRGEYSGDNAYLPSTDATLGECFTVSTQPTHVDTGQKATISDTATPTGFGTPTGTVTFQLFTTSDCSGSPLYSSGPIQIANGKAQTTPDPSLTLKDNGTYKWLVSYSGDANNLPSTSPCGTEQTTISGNTPGVDP